MYQCQMMIALSWIEIDGVNCFSCALDSILLNQLSRVSTEDFKGVS
jgi:hypothetical protein